MTYRTPLARIRGLGSAKEGTDHFWTQRLTAASNLVLVTFLIFLLVYAFVVYVLPILLGLRIVILAFVYGRRLLRRWRLSKSR